MQKGAVHRLPRMPLKLWILERWVNFGSRTRLLDRQPTSELVGKLFRKAARKAALISAATLCLWAGEVVVGHLRQPDSAMEGKRSQLTQERLPLPKTEGIQK